MSCLTPYKVPQIIQGRFLQWTAVNYFLEDQTEPIDICPPSSDECVYQFPDLTETYKIPVQNTDVVNWIINRNEITIDGGSSVSDLKIGIVQEGVLVAADIGTVSEVEGGTQYYCTATVPCLDENCNYQLVIYDNTIGVPIDCTLFECSTLQDLIDSGYTLGECLDCTLSDWECTYSCTIGANDYLDMNCSDLVNFIAGQTIGLSINGGPIEDYTIQVVVNSPPFACRLNFPADTFTDLGAPCIIYN